MTESENPGADARRKYEDAAFVEALRDHAPASTKEIGEAVGCPRRTADYRLRKLRDEGSVGSKEIGNSLMWYLSEG